MAGELLKLEVHAEAPMGIASTRAQRIRELVGAVRINIICIGLELIAAKQQLPHGEWLPWLEREFGWSLRTAERFTKVAEVFTDGKLDTVSNFSDLSIDAKALYLLSGPAIPENVRDFVAAQGKRLTLEWLPAYAPELNPVEHIWGYLKQNELPNLCPRDLSELSTAACAALRRMRRRPTLVTAFWKQAELFECHYIMQSSLDHLSLRSIPRPELVRPAVGDQDSNVIAQISSSRDELPKIAFPSSFQC
jgi:hypothetical protein